MDANFKKEVIDCTIEDIKVELDREFGRNFVRKSFFDEQKWKETKFSNPKGSLMQRSGGLRKSITSRKRKEELIYQSHKPYARIHNEGGEIKVTKRMRGYFMHQLREVRGRYQRKKSGERRGNSRNRTLSKQEKFYRAMVGKKVGDTIKIPQRKFIGHGKATDKIIREVVNDNLEEYFKNHPIIKPQK